MQTPNFKDWNQKEQLKHVGFNDGLPETVVQACKLSHCVLADKHLKDVSFVGGSIVHSRFENCRLTDARFERVDLTGTVFVACDLRNASFLCCKLWYARFDNCDVDYGSLISSAPPETNLRLEFFRRLRVNATETGEKAWADRLLVLELQTREEELLNIAIGRTEYYRKKYSGLERFRAVSDLATQVVNRLWWGYGLRLSNLATSGIIVVAAFAALYHTTSARYAIDERGSSNRLTWPQSFYYSVVAFTTGGFGDIRPANAAAKMLTGLEGVVGVLFLGFFAAAMYRRLAK